MLKGKTLFEAAQNAIATQESFVQSIAKKYGFDLTEHRYSLKLHLLVTQHLHLQQRGQAPDQGVPHEYKDSQDTGRGTLECVRPCHDLHDDSGFHLPPTNRHDHGTQADSPRDKGAGA